MATPPTIPILDAHVHLWPADELDSLAWIQPDTPLHAQFSADEYLAATASTAGTLRGCIFVEADRAGRDPADWSAPLAELAFLARVAAGAPRPGQGHAAADRALCRAIVPWAPVAAGPAKLAEYLRRAREAAGPAWRRIRGVRYLLQDQPAGAMLAQDFVDGLRLLGRAGLVFDLGVDQHRRGRAQLEEAVEMIDRAHDGVPEDEKVVFIVGTLLSCRCLPRPCRQQNECPRATAPLSPWGRGVWQVLSLDTAGDWLSYLG